MITGNPVALEPALHSRVIPMAELARDRANSAFGSDYLSVIKHGDSVRSLRTSVNVESVRNASDCSRMADSTTLGEKLRALHERSGLSYDAIAKKAGYTGRSGVQRYFSPDYDAQFLPLSVAQKLAKGFSGSGVSEDEIISLTGIPTNNAVVVRYEGASETTLRRDLPVYGTSLGAPRDFDGKAIEQTMLNSGNVIAYLPRPTVLNGQAHAYGLYVQGSSMAPRFEDGETIFATHAEHSRPPRIGDDVVVYIRDIDDDDGHRASAALVKRLVRRTATYIELEQFSPAITFRIDAAMVLRMDRVIPWSELLS